VAILTHGPAGCQDTEGGLWRSVRAPGSTVLAGPVEL